MKLTSNDICVQSREMLRHDANQLRVHVLAEGYQLMHSVKVLMKSVKSAQGRTKEDLSSELLSILVEAIVRSSTRTPSTMLACKSLFELMLAVHIPRERLFECMLAEGSESVAADMDVDGRDGGGAAAGTTTFVASGESFVQTFKQELSEYFIRSAKHFMPMLFAASGNPLAVRMLHSVVTTASSMTTTNTRAYEAEDVRNRIEAISEFLTCAFPVDVPGSDGKTPMLPLAKAESDSERCVELAFVVCVCVCVCLCLWFVCVCLCLCVCAWGGGGG
jgi:hypothetical protein